MIHRAAGATESGLLTTDCCCRPEWCGGTGAASTQQSAVSTQRSACAVRACGADQEWFIAPQARPRADCWLL